MRSAAFDAGRPSAAAAPQPATGRPARACCGNDDPGGDRAGNGFEVGTGGELLLRLAGGEDDTSLAVALRHGLELCLLLRLWPDARVLAGLAAAGTAALFSVLEGPPTPSSEAIDALAGEGRVDTELAERLRAILRRHQPGAPATIQSGVLPMLHCILAGSARPSGSCRPAATYGSWLIHGPG